MESASVPRRFPLQQSTLTKLTLLLKWGRGRGMQEFYERGTQGPAWEVHSEGKLQVS